ncbi:oligosaccharide flippase family protein [Pseudomonadales bacterium]|nr:oligosaccharide flippase family protein [Pseudomonadales bacterium]
MNEKLISSRFKRLAAEGTWIVVGQIAAVLGALALVRVLTEYLEPAQYGRLALGLTVAGLVNQVIMGGVTLGIGRFYSIAAEKNDLTGYMNASRQLMGYATGAVAVIGLLLSVGLFWLDHYQWLGLVASALLYSVLSGYHSCLGGIQNAARQRAIVAFHGALDAWLKILLAVSLIFLFGSSITAVILGFALSSLLMTCSQLFFLRRRIDFEGVKTPAPASWGRQIWTYSKPFSIFGIFTWFYIASDRWALQTFASAEDVGFYAVVFQLGYVPVGLATGMMTGFLGPILWQRSGNGQDQARNTSVHRIVWRVTLASLLVTALTFALTFLLHGWIFTLLVATEYHSVSYLLPWMVLAGGLFAAGQIFALKLMSEMKSSAMMAVKIVTAIFGVGLNIYGASQFGLLGVVAALVAFSATYFSWMTWLALRSPTLVNHPLGET